MKDMADFEGVPSFPELNRDEWHLDQIYRLDADLLPSFGLEARVLALRKVKCGCARTAVGGAGVGRTAAFEEPQSDREWLDRDA